MKNIDTYIIEKLQINKDSKVIKLPEIQDAFEYALECADKIIQANDKYKVITKATRLTTVGLTYGIKFEVSLDYFKEHQLMQDFGDEVLKEVKKKYKTDTDELEVHAYDDCITLFIDWDKILDEEVTEKLHLDKHTNIHQDDQITKDFKKLAKILHKEGADEEMYDSLIDMMEFYDDSDYNDYYYKWDEHKFYTFFREVVNYDWISLYGGRVNIAESNHKEVAKIIKKYATKEMVKKVMLSFGW